jgi:hypothetical protein
MAAIVPVMTQLQEADELRVTSYELQGTPRRASRSSGLPAIDKLQSASHFPAMDVMLLVHVAASWAMVGFIWTIQLVQYPVMATVPAAGFVAFERAHQRRVARPLMVFGIVEVVTAGWLLVASDGSTRPTLLVAGAILAVLWVSTGLWYAPLHGRLTAGFDADVHRRLVRTNWARTVLWTGRGVVVLTLL